MPLQEKRWKRDNCILRVFGTGNHRKIRITRCALLRTSGIEDDERNTREIVNDKKLASNIRRAKNKIFELAYCNPWDYFFTATLDKRKYDRTDLETFHKDLTQFISNYNKKHDCDIKFLLIPELHSDGKSWHMHGLLANVPFDDLKQFQVGMRMGKSLADKVKRGDVVYKWGAYQKKFGFCDLEPIRNVEAVSKYITKYINKNLATSVTELGAHLYYRSRGLKTAETVAKGYWREANTFEPSYTADMVMIYEFDYSDELLAALVAGFDDEKPAAEYWTQEHYNIAGWGISFHEVFQEPSDMPF